MIIASVLRSGGNYSAKWVQALARGVAEHSEHELVCLTDVKVDGVSVLAAPVEVEFTGSIPDGTDNVVVPLPLAGASVIVPGLSKIEVICSGSWSGNEEGGDFPPSFLGLAELEVE